MTATTPRTSAQSPTSIQAYDIANVGINALDWLETVLYAIEVLDEKGSVSAFHIKNLVGLGRHLANDELAGEVSQ